MFCEKFDRSHPQLQSAKCRYGTLKSAIFFQENSQYLKNSTRYILAHLLFRGGSSTSNFLGEEAVGAWGLQRVVMHAVGSRDRYTVGYLGDAVSQKLKLFEKLNIIFALKFGGHYHGRPPFINIMGACPPVFPIGIDARSFKIWCVRSTNTGDYNTKVEIVTFWTIWQKLTHFTKDLRKCWTDLYKIVTVGRDIYWRW